MESSQDRKRYASSDDESSVEASQSGSQGDLFAQPVSISSVFGSDSNGSDSYGIYFRHSSNGPDFFGDKEDDDDSITDIEAEEHRARTFKSRVRQSSSTLSHSQSVSAFQEHHLPELPSPLSPSLPAPPEDVLSLHRSSSLPSMAFPHASGKVRALNQGNIIVVALLERLCALAVSDMSHAKKMLKTIVTRLAQLKIINDIPIEETAGIRALYGEAVYHLLDEAFQALDLSRSCNPALLHNDDRTESEPSSALVRVTNGGGKHPFAMKVPIEHSRYESEFDELEDLGSGGFGSVVKARHRIDKTNYAVKKVMLIEDLCPKVLEEVQTLAKLEHPRVIRYHTAWIEKGSGLVQTEDCEETSFDSNADGQTMMALVTLYIQMELCQSSLYAWLRSRSKFVRKASITIFHQLLEAVDYIHSQGLMHRDIKPQNVFIKDGASIDIRLGDFGLARATPTQSPNYLGNAMALLSSDRPMSSGVGTATYAAPEQLHGHTYDNKCDIYSLGLILLELFHPFSTEMERHDVLMELKQHHTLSASFLQQHPFIGTVVLSMAAEQPEHRPSVADLLRGDLSSFASDLMAVEPPAFEKLVSLPDGSVIERVRLVNGHGASNEDGLAQNGEIAATKLEALLSASPSTDGELSAQQQPAKPPAQDVMTATPTTLEEAHAVIAKLRQLVMQKQEEIAALTSNLRDDGCYASD
eukprot:TRINITY_DN9862_c0_g1_i2.p1 TRINITY_DN9862_c0_g1~~TRINITY_DN9862_c0_g1_i2.p1  ORF type:complete len:697 (+),score=163.20 TRINITY_DN9862_c0_g1_i2:103-2193(+)